MRKVFHNDPVDPREEYETCFEKDPKGKFKKEDLDTLDGWTDDSNDRA